MLPHLVVLRHCLPIVHEEDFKRVRHHQSHLRSSRPVVVIPPPLGPAPALLTSSSSHLCSTSRGGGFRCGRAGRRGSGLRLGKVLLKGQVGLVEFEEARRGDPFVPATKRNKQKKGESQRARQGAHARAWGVGDARLLPAFVVHEVMGSDGV